MEAPQYSGLSTHAKWVYVSIVLATAMVLVDIDYDVRLLKIYSDAANGAAIGLADVEAFDSQVEDIRGFEAILWFVSLVAFLSWKFRAYRNLASFHVLALKYSAGWAVGAYFVPILSAFRPYQIMRELWMASDPSNPETEETGGLAWMRSSPSATIAWWWTFLLIVIVLPRILSRVGEFETTLEGYITLAWATVASHVLMLVSFVFTCLMIRKITSMQGEKHATIQTQVVME